MEKTKYIFLTLLFLIGCSSGQPTNQLNTKPSVPLTETGKEIIRQSDRMSEETRKISEATSEIKQESTNIKLSTEDPKIEDSANKIDDSANTIKTETDKLNQAIEDLKLQAVKVNELASQVNKLEKENTELKDWKKMEAEKATKALYEYSTFFYGIGFLVLIGGGALTFLYSKQVGVMLILLGAMIIGLAAAATYYLQYIAIIGLVILILSILAALGTIVKMMFDSKTNGTVAKETIDLMEKMKKELPLELREKYFGNGGVADKVQSKVTKEVVRKLRKDPTPKQDLS
jgi:ABC-type multidrug transport system fused ATPase/permease subunit